MPFSLHHLMRRPEIESKTPPLILLLHGVGSNEYDLFGLAPYLPPEFLVLSARAPLPLGPQAHGWYPMEVAAGGYKIDPEMGIVSRKKIAAFIGEALTFYQADPARVYLVGFSQGAIMSYSIMMTQPELLAGVVAMSGRLVPDLYPEAVSPEKLDRFPIMVTHGKHDEVLPISDGRAANEILSTLPVDLSYQEYEMAHEINANSLRDILEWLEER